MNKNILIMVGAVKYNRGSEALLRGISKICKSKYNDAVITVVQEEDKYESLNIENIDVYTKR